MIVFTCMVVFMFMCVFTFIFIFQSYRIHIYGDMYMSDFIHIYMYVQACREMERETG